MVDFPHGCHGFKVFLSSSTEIGLEGWQRADRIRVGDTIKNTDKQTGTRNKKMYNRIQKEKDFE